MRSLLLCSLVLFLLSACGVSAMTYDLNQFYAGLEKHEGFSRYPYDDATGKRLMPGEKPKGKATIGIGRNLEAEPLTPAEQTLLAQNRPDLGKRNLYRDGISEEEAWYLANTMRKQNEHALDKAIPWWRTLSSPRQIALMDIAYNVGVKGLLGFHDMLHAMQTGDYKTAAYEALNSVAAKETGVKFGGDLADAEKTGTTRYGELAAMIADDKTPPMPHEKVQFASSASEPITASVPAGMAASPIADEIQPPIDGVLSPEDLQAALDREPKNAQELAANIGEASTPESAPAGQDIAAEVGQAPIQGPAQKPVDRPNPVPGGIVVPKSKGSVNTDDPFAAPE